jgi:hypothetical protein
MYWTDAEGVKRAALDGTKQELVTQGPARGFIALDLVAQQMYWADWPSGDIKTAPMTLEPPVTNVLTKQSCPFGIADPPPRCRPTDVRAQPDLRRTRQHRLARSDRLANLGRLGR